jgi:hypothetical protein
MADGKQTKTTGTDGRQQEIRELLRTGKAFTFIGNAIKKAYQDEETGEYYVEAVSSSDQADLVDDMFTSKALGIMKSGFIGKTAFMNHRTNVPDDVFGSVVETDLIKQDGMQLFVVKFVVEQENEPAMKTWRMLNAGRVQLGTSVTVLVRSAKPNPNRKGGLIIDDIEPIEISIVGVPCNRESKTMTATATKALKLDNSDEELMETPNTDETKQAAAPAIAPEAPEAAEVADTPAEPSAESAPAAPAAEATVSEDQPAVEEVTEPPSETTAESKFFQRALATMAAVKAAIDANDRTALKDVSVKGMFADRVDHPTFYDLLDVLCDCYYTLYYRAWNIKYDGGDDFSEVLAEYATCLEEFKAAALDSFEFWHASADSESKSLTAIEAETFRKSVEQVASLIEAQPETAEQLRAIGEDILAVAQKAGIPFNAQPAGEVVDITKTKEFSEMATRAQQAEADAEQLKKELAQVQDDLEVTKAGLKVAVEALDDYARQPLQARPKN